MAKDYSKTGVLVHITSRSSDLEIFHSLWMPEVPRKGDFLWLNSLTRGIFPDPEVVVERVEWSMDQRSGVISAWVRVAKTYIEADPQLPNVLLKGSK